MQPDKIPNTIDARIQYLSHCSRAEWESICKGCGLCCLCKVARHDGIYYSRVACDWLNLDTHRCRIYRWRLCKSFCKKVNLRVVLGSGLLPDICGYREFIYGKSDKNIHVDFSTVVHLNDIRSNNIELKHFLIPESLNWCSGRQR